MKRKPVWLKGMVILMAVGMLFGCTPAKTPDDPVTPINPPIDPPVEPVDPPVEKYVKLTEKGEKLYENTYQSMLDRLSENGYAQTSLTGAYQGMFVRDASIQVMAHIAGGDMEEAKEILQYMIGFHRVIGAEHAVHIMSSPTVQGNESNMLGAVDPRTGIVEQTVNTAGLYKITLPGNQAAQKVSLSFDSIKEISVYLQNQSSEGEFVLKVGRDKDDASLGTVRKEITKAGNDWVTFAFDTPIDLGGNGEVVFTIGAEGTNGNVVAPGILSQGQSFNFDRAAYGGWRDCANSLAYRILTPEAVARRDGEETINPDNIAHEMKIGGEKTLTFDLPAALNGKVVTDLTLYLSGLVGEGTNETYTLTLRCGDQMIDRITRPIGTLKTVPSSVKFSFNLPMIDVGARYSVELSASCADSVSVFGQNEMTPVTYRAEYSNLSPYSEKVQVDGNYMFVNAYAMFALAAGEEYAWFIDQSYDLIKGFADAFLSDEYLNENGLLRNPSYEHSRDGRYWDDYDLITNCFAAEAQHKMGMLAEKLGKTADATDFSMMADVISNGINENLVSEFKGKKIYTELIALDEGGKVYKGFSFVNLAPIASEWYAVDEEIMANTYEMYLTYGSENYGSKKYQMLAVTVEFNESDKRVKVGDHVIGKGLAWELYYLWKTGDRERLENMLSFIDAKSKEIYPEVWHRSGSVSDSGNQEQASWLLYEIARITGKTGE